MHIRPDRYFDLEGLPTEEISRLLGIYMGQGKKLVLLACQVSCSIANNIRDFLIDRNIRTWMQRQRKK